MNKLSKWFRTHSEVELYKYGSCVGFTLAVGWEIMMGVLKSEARIPSISAAVVPVLFLLMFTALRSPPKEEED